MGRLNEPVIQHFSHPHPLHLTSLNQQQSLVPLLCANCTLPAASSGLAYTCKPCNFNLHVKCAQMPPHIQHPSHPAHQLTLLPVPTNPKGSFDCMACGRQGTGFSYHCSVCSVDLHTLCASMPLSVSSTVHAHPLALVFSLPYENKGFSCDVCMGTGSGHWLYRCAPCEFDAHLECGGLQDSPLAGTGQVGMINRSVSGATQGLSRSGSGRGGGLVRQMVQGLVGAASQQIGHKFLPGYSRSGVGRGENACGANARARGGPATWNVNQGGRIGGYGAWNGNAGGGAGGSPSATSRNGGSRGVGRFDQNGYGAGATNASGASGDAPADWNGYVVSGDGSGAWNGYM